jgi:hypothetical protein
VFVESAGHERLYTQGITEANVSGNVIVNVTTESRTTTQQGNRVVALQSLQAGLARLSAGRGAQWTADAHGGGVVAGLCHGVGGQSETGKMVPRRTKEEIRNEHTADRVA